jgi:ABC-type transport system involved in multi-copper enzyme maturation permease subunit
MSNAALQISTLAAKEIADARRTHVVLVVMAFMMSAGCVALTAAALALNDEVTTYHTSRELLMSLGRSADELTPPGFYPLRLLRGFIEHIQILGAILGILLGYRAAAVEHGRNTLALLLTRPLSNATFLAGKCLGNLTVVLGALALTFAIGAIGITGIGGVVLTGDELARMAVTFLAAALYVSFFFAVGFGLALSMRRSAHALLLGFSLWLAFVLIAPQIGDTLDPDNQVAGGVFRTLGVEKPQAREILKSFATYEAIRDGIEQASPAKHFERWSFAVLGIKESYSDQPLATVMKDRVFDGLWLLGLFAMAFAVLFLRRLDVTRLTRE